MPDLWFPLDELIGDRVDRARSTWDNIIGSRVGDLSRSIQDPIVTDRVNRATSRFDTLSAGPARGLLSSPGGIANVINPIGLAGAIGSEIGGRADTSGLSFPTSPPAPTSPSPFTSTTRDRIGSATSRFDDLLGGLAEKGGTLGEKKDEYLAGRSARQEQARQEEAERNRQREARIKAFEPVYQEQFGQQPKVTDLFDAERRKSILSPESLTAFRPPETPAQTANLNPLHQGALEDIKQARESYTKLADNPERLPRLAKTVGELALTGASGMPTAITRAQDPAFRRRAGEAFETFNDIQNILPDPMNVAQNLTFNVAEKGLSETGLPGVVTFPVAFALSLDPTNPRNTLRLLKKGGAEALKITEPLTTRLASNLVKGGIPDLSPADRYVLSRMSPGQR